MRGEAKAFYGMTFHAPHPIDTAAVWLGCGSCGWTVPVEPEDRAPEKLDDYLTHECPGRPETVVPV